MTFDTHSSTLLPLERNHHACSPATDLLQLLPLSRPSLLRRYKMDQLANSTLAEPLDLVKLALGEYVSPSWLTLYARKGDADRFRRVFIKLRGERTVTGILHVSLSLSITQLEMTE